MNTIQSVAVNEWKDKNTLAVRGYFVQGALREGGTYSILARTKEEADAHVAVLTPLVGQTVELVLERRGEYNGVPKFDLKGYPGMPARQGGGGGGRGNFVPRYRDTAEGFAQEQQSIHRSVALQHSVAHLAGTGVGTTAVLRAATDFYAWLSTGVIPPPADDSIPF